MNTSLPFYLLHALSDKSLLALKCKHYTRPPHLVLKFIFYSKEYGRQWSNSRLWYYLINQLDLNHIRLRADYASAWLNPPKASLMEEDGPYTKPIFYLNTFCWRPRLDIWNVDFAQLDTSMGGGSSWVG